MVAHKTREGHGSFLLLKEKGMYSLHWPFTLSFNFSFSWKLLSDFKDHQHVHDFDVMVRENNALRQKFGLVPPDDFNKAERSSIQGIHCLSPDQVELYVTAAQNASSKMVGDIKACQSKWFWMSLWQFAVLTCSISLYTFCAKQSWT